MPRFFCDEISGKTARITGTDALHIYKSLRASPGDKFTLCDGKGYDYYVTAESVSADEILFSVLEKFKNETEPEIKVTLFQCLPKGDKFDGIIQKSVELGVYNIVPVISEFCVSRPDFTVFEKRRERLNKIALAAAKQCGRGIIPKVLPINTFDETLEEIKNAPTLFFYEGGGDACDKYIDKNTKRLNILIGPEGGFSDSEAKSVTAAGAKAVTLGKRILRTETAPVTALSVVMFLTGNLS